MVEFDVLHVHKIIIEHLCNKAENQVAHNQRDPPDPVHRECLIDCLGLVFRTGVGITIGVRRSIDRSTNRLPMQQTIK